MITLPLELLLCGQASSQGPHTTKGVVRDRQTTINHALNENLYYQRGIMFPVALFVASALTLVLLCAQASHAEVKRQVFSDASRYVFIEILDDDLIHVEYSAMGTHPPTTQPLYSSPMVLKNDYIGPASLSVTGTVLETLALRIEVDAASLCIMFRDRTRANAELTTVCPANLDQAWKGFNVNPAQIQQLYGLGSDFKTLGSADGDWLAHKKRDGVTGDPFGNRMKTFQEAMVGNVQIPVLYATGPSKLNYSLLLDNVYLNTWNFETNWWEVRMFGDHVRFYFMQGADLLDLRRDFMELVGRPPVPPRKAFGLWVSEFGYDNWDQIGHLKSQLRSKRFPVDGFVLDLNWFGGVNRADKAQSRMGRLNWDTKNNDGNHYQFPDPAAHIQALAGDHIGIMAIEESYLNSTTDTFAQMPKNFSTYKRTNGKCDGAIQSTSVDDTDGFWGTGRMIDWSDPEAGKWIHDQRRFPNLVKLGVNFHWTDLGEPESYVASACYEGIEQTSSGRKNEHPDLHNLYNLFWNASIWGGYASQSVSTGQAAPRPFILTRSGAAGTQRFGAAMWSGDIASNLLSLASHFNAQMHMSFSGGRLLWFRYRRVPP